MSTLSVSTLASDIPLLLRLLVGLRLTGRLRVSQNRWTGDVFFDRGRLVAAVFGAEHGIPALEAILLGLPDGRCTFMEGEVAAPPNIELSTRALIMHLQVLAKHQTELGDAVPSLAAVPRARAVEPPTASGVVVTVPHSMLATSVAIDGRRCVGEIAGNRGVVRTLDDLATLVDLGLIEIVIPTRRQQLFAALRARFARAHPDTWPAALRRPLRRVPWHGLPAGVRPWATGQRLLGSTHGDRNGRHRARAIMLLEAAPDSAAPANVPTPPEILPEMAARASVAGVETSASPPGRGEPAGAPLVPASLLAGTPEPDSTAEHEPAPAVDASADKSQRWLGIGYILLVLTLVVCLATWSLVGAIVGRAPDARGEASGGRPADARGGSQGPLPQPVRDGLEGSPASPSSTDPRAPLRLVLATNFASNPENWPNDPASTAWIVDGAYHILARQPGQFVALSAPLSTAYRDVLVSMKVRKVGGPAGGGYGFILRDQGPGPRDGANQLGKFYALIVNDRGEVGISRRENDHWAEVVPWTPSAAVHPGNEANTLVALARGSQLGLAVNGTAVAIADDQAPSVGTVGLYVGGDLTEIAVEDFRVQAPAD